MNNEFYCTNCDLKLRIHNIHPPGVPHPQRPPAFNFCPSCGEQSCFFKLEEDDQLDTSLKLSAL